MLRAAPQTVALLGTAEETSVGRQQQHAVLVACRRGHQNPARVIPEVACCVRGGNLRGTPATNRWAGCASW